MPFRNYPSLFDIKSVKQVVISIINMMNIDRGVIGIYLKAHIQVILNIFIRFALFRFKFGNFVIN